MKKENKFEEDIEINKDGDTKSEKTEFYNEEKSENSELLSLREEKTNLLATLENQRKSHLREIDEIVKYSNKKILLKIIPLLDDYERALNFVDKFKDQQIRNFVVGFEMVLNNLKKNLHSEGVEEYVPSLKTEIWDSKFCEVVDEVENNSYEPGTIMEVVQKGYLLHERVLVTSKVIVSKKVLQS